MPRAKVRTLPSSSLVSPPWLRRPSAPCLPVVVLLAAGALNSMTVGLVRPFGQAGIRINTVSPGMTHTDMVDHLASSFDMSQVPLGRMGAPAEVANAVAWLCSDEASYVAGANLRVSGGRPPGTLIG